MSDRASMLSTLTGQAFAAAQSPDVPQIADAPPNVVPLRPMQTEGIAPASGSGDPAVNDQAPMETLAEAVARSLGAEPGPAPSTQPDSTAPSATTQSFLPPEVQRELDELRAFRTQQEIEQREAVADARFQQTWDGIWSNGYGVYDQYESRIRAYGEEQGWSEREIKGEIALRIDEPRQANGQGWMGRKQWEEITTNKQLNALDTELRGRHQPSELDQLVTQYGLTPDMKTQLQSLPDKGVQRQVAAMLGATIQRQGARDTAIATQAREVAAQTFVAGSFGPGSPAPANRRPHQFTAEEHQSKEAGNAVASIMLNRWRAQFGRQAN